MSPMPRTFVTRALSLGIALAAFGSLGAKGEGCSAQYQPGDGSAESWATGKVPTPEPVAEPMTCEWLESDNCWKRLVRKAKACAATASEKGTFSEDRASCTYPAGGKWQLEGPLDTPAPSSTLFPIVNWRLLDDKGVACATGKVLGVGKHMIDVQGEVAVFENPTLTKYRVTCPDGSTYTNEAETGAAPAPDAGPDADTTADGGSEPSAAGAVCSSFGVRWLQHKVPGVLMSCSGSEKNCKLDLWGGPDAQETRLTTCSW